MMKKLFGLLTFILIGLINFGYCTEYYEFATDDMYFRYITNGNSTTLTDVDSVCVYVDSNCTNNNCGTLTVDGITYNLKGSWLSGVGKVFCAKGTNYTISVPGYYYYIFSLNFFETMYPQLTSQQCQSEYDLMPISDYTSANCMVDFNLLPVSVVNQNYCVNNGLCPSSSCSGNVNTGDIQWSALYINQIQHVSAPVINIDIPTEFNWDYTGNEDEFNLNIEGYNVDTDYIEGVINLQNSKPNQVDLNNIIQVIIPLFVPGLVIILFIYFIFRFLKKIF